MNFFSFFRKFLFNLSNDDKHRIVTVFGVNLRFYSKTLILQNILREQELRIAELTKKSEDLEKIRIKTEQTLRNMNAAFHGGVMFSLSLANKLFGVDSDALRTANIADRAWVLKHSSTVLEKYNTLDIPTASNRVISYFDSDTAWAGLIDRLRTMACSWIMAKESDLDFYIYHDAGFKLEDYLEPNEIDWRIARNEVHFNLNYVCLLLHLNSFRKLERIGKDYHTYQLPIVDAFVSTSESLQEKYTDYSVFHKLFKFSSSVQKLAESYMSQLSLKECEYVAVHARFLNYFEQVETHGSVTTSLEQRLAMKESLRMTLQSVHDETGLPIILFSDSNSVLLDEYPDYVKVIPGSAGHISKHSGESDITMKVFVDLYILSKACKIFSLTGDGLYNSGFSRYAANIGNVPFVRRALK